MVICTLPVSGGMLDAGRVMCAQMLHGREAQPPVNRAFRRNVYARTRMAPGKCCADRSSGALFAGYTLPSLSLCLSVCWLRQVIVLTSTPLLQVALHPFRKVG